MTLYNELPSFSQFLVENQQLPYKVGKTNRYKPKKIPKAAMDHIQTLEDILSKGPRSVFSDEDRQTLRQKFSEERITKNNSLGDQVNTYMTDHDIYRYHLPSVKGLPSGRKVIHVAFAKDNSGVTFMSFHEHE